VTVAVICCSRSRISLVSARMRWASSRRVSAAALVVSRGVPSSSGVQRRGEHGVAQAREGVSRSGGSPRDEHCCELVDRLGTGLQSGSLGQREHPPASSTGPSPAFALPLARPRSTARAADSASRVPVFTAPAAGGLVRLVDLDHRDTAPPAGGGPVPHRKRPVHSTPARRTVPDLLTQASNAR
jgi:hypothetical protein